MYISSFRSPTKIDINYPDFKLKIKISEDGTTMSRLTSFVVISFYISLFWTMGMWCHQEASKINFIFFVLFTHITHTYIDAIMLWFNYDCYDYDHDYD